LGEIEAALVTYPSLKACTVVFQDDAVGNKKMTAFLVMRTNEVVSLEDLRTWAEKRLPEYMIPSRFGIVSSLPMTPSGKVDRKALERLDAVELPSATTYEAPRSELQTALVGIWQAALGRQEVGIHDNFFHLGGHSLLAVVICLKMKEVLGIEIPLRWIFLNPTIESLSARIQALPQGSDGADEKLDQEISVRLADRGLPLPASFAQQGMWLLQQTLPDPSTYNLFPAWILEGSIDRDAVRRALRIIQLRHEVLRTSLVYAEGNLLQCIAAPEALPLPWQEVDLRELAEEERAAALEERLLAEARQPFDLAQAPLWRAVWIQTAEHEQVLGLSFHHSIMDEWSIRLFVHELQYLYDTGGNEESAGLPELPVQYADFAVWQRERLTGERLVAASNYWREQLRDLPPFLEWPADLLTPSRRSGRGGCHSFHLPREVVARLDELSRQENATRFMTALAAYQVWLYRYTGQSDQVVGTPITSRERPEFQNLIGFFLNTLPIRSQVEGGEGFRSILRSVRQTVLDAFEQAILPFEKIVELAVTERGADLQPLHQVMFVLLEHPSRDYPIGNPAGLCAIGSGRCAAPIRAPLVRCLDI
jgi:acyl carrier protein